MKQLRWLSTICAARPNGGPALSEIDGEPTDQPYGIREFGVRDINGVGIVFGQDIDHA